jgi:acetyltransferase-like isoleucine patch superfamily enzyme
MKKFLTAFFALLPSKFPHLFLKILGHKISWKSKIGFSILLVDKLELNNFSSIGHFNFIKVTSLKMDKGSIIKNLNYFKGPIMVCLGDKSIIGRLNKFTRGFSSVTYGKSSLTLGAGTGITYSNFLDLTCSITFGNHSQVAGMGSQFWTHGYVHAKEGVDRIIVYGDITIGNNVYIGTSCLFNPGVSVANAINIGGNSSISKDLKISGMYVNQPLRYIEMDMETTKAKLQKVEIPGLLDKVYSKNKIKK